MSSSLLLALALFTASETLEATSFYPVPLEQRLDDATVIVRGRTGKSYARWVHAGGGKRIYTYAPLDVLELMKGQLKGGQKVSSILVRELGGEVDGVGMKVPGAARFSNQEEVVLMLGAENEDGSYPLRALMMGKLRVEQDDQGRSILRGAALQMTPENHSGHGHVHDQKEERKQWLLSDFRKLVQQVLSKPLPKQGEASSNPAVGKNGGGTSSAVKTSSHRQKTHEKKTESIQSASSENWKIPLILGIIGIGVLLFWWRRRS